MPSLKSVQKETFNDKGEEGVGGTESVALASKQK
jgi:hypothetical protein